MYSYYWSYQKRGSTLSNSYNYYYLYIYYIIKFINDKKQHWVLFNKRSAVHDHSFKVAMDWLDT